MIQEVRYFGHIMETKDVIGRLCGGNGRKKGKRKTTCTQYGQMPFYEAKIYAYDFLSWMIWTFCTVAMIFDRRI